MNLVTVKAKDAPLRALDWAVLVYLGRTSHVSWSAMRRAPADDAGYIHLKKGGIFAPTEKWDQIGPLLAVRWRELTVWLQTNIGENWEAQVAGDTVLPMLVRALVASNVEEFEVPQELVP